MKSIYLIGFSGSGKSTVGPILARKLKAKFFDTDVIIEKKYKKTINDIFQQDGEKTFRRYEQTVILKVINDGSFKKVIALGGGAFENSKIRRLVKNDGLVIFLSCSRKDIYRRIKNKTDRPLLNIKTKVGETAAKTLINKIKLLLCRRIKNYNKADIKLSTTGKTVNEAVTQLEKLLEKYYACH
ncbi:MAG: shikimate kinase [Candidatus Zixiibacteriota bacterium]